MSKAMRGAHAILAALQVVTGAAGLGDIIGERWAGLVVLLVGAVQAGLVVYDQGLQTPVPTNKPADGS